MRVLPLAICFTFFLAYKPSALAQTSPPAQSQSRKSQDAITKKDADAETELQKALANAANDRAALVRNLKNYLERFPDAPRRAAVYRALVEACDQLRDNSCALDFAERLIAIEPDDSEMMMLAVKLLEQDGSGEDLTRAAGYVTRVLDRVEKSSPDDRSARVSLAEWQDHHNNLCASLYFLRGQVENSQHNLPAAKKDLESSYSLHPNATAAELLGEIAELQKDPATAIKEYSLAFVLPESGPAGKVDRREVRQKLGNVWRQVHGSDQGLGEQILTSYDGLAAPPANSSPAARNAPAKDPFEFVLRDLDSKAAPLAPFKGKIIVLSFWATWCGPCRALEPLFVRVAQSYAGNPQIAFFAVNTDEEQSLVAPFVAHEKWDVPVVFADGLDDFLKVDSLPTVLVLDRSGKTFYRADGFAPETFSESLLTAIQVALKPPPAAPSN